MNKISDFIYAIMGLALLGGFGYFIFIMFESLLQNIDKININLAVGVLGGTVTITGYFISRYLERKKIIEMEIRNKKIPIYEEFVSYYFYTMFNEKKNTGKGADPKMVNFFRDFNQKAIIWFPDEVLKSYLKWKKDITRFTNGESSLHDAIYQQEEFLKAIRQDIGHKNKNFEKFEISSIYINDIDDVIEAAKNDLKTNQ